MMCFQAVQILALGAICGTLLSESWPEVCVTAPDLLPRFVMQRTA